MKVKSEKIIQIYLASCKSADKLYEVMWPQISRVMDARIYYFAEICVKLVNKAKKHTIGNLSVLCNRLSSSYLPDLSSIGTYSVLPLQTLCCIKAREAKLNTNNLPEQIVALIKQEGRK